MKQFKSVDCGDQHTALVTPSGDLYTLGDNSEGQLGLGIDYKTFTDKPTLVTGVLDRIQSVACGYRHTLVLTERGQVYGMGSNRRYELGMQPQTPKCLAPHRIQALDIYNVTKVKAGSFSAALTSEQEILVWGTGEFGQVQSPIKICTEGVRFKDISLGKGRESFGVALDTDGFVYSWGDNQTGQLGQGDFSVRKLPTKINQLRKKKVCQVQCGAGFVAALGKDVPEGY
jgi:alpha-tubulin suppressor-like RCC1 family protein